MVGLEEYLRFEVPSEVMAEPDRMMLLTSMGLLAFGACVTIDPRDMRLNADGETFLP